MNLLEKIIDFLSYELKSAPTMYGWFHIMFLVIVFITCIFVFLRYRHANDRLNRIILLTISSIMLLFEVYKQLVFSAEGTNWDYQWYAFPFQFCSVPMYVAFITGLLKDGKLRDCLYSFLGTFTLFAGIAVMFYPDTVFINTLGISIQTMVHHGLMVVLGVYVIASKRMKIEHRSIFKASLVFSILVAMAYTMNIVFHKVDGVFNMFFIGPYYSCHLPILSGIQANYGHVVFLITYILGFSFVAYLMLLIAIGLNKAFKNIHIVNNRLVVDYSR